MAHMDRRRQVVGHCRQHQENPPQAFDKRPTREIALPLVQSFAPQPVVEATTSDSKLSPIALATQRQQRRGGKIRGLRPSLSSSPMMQDLQVGYEQPVRDGITLMHSNTENLPSVSAARSVTTKPQSRDVNQKKDVSAAGPSQR